MPKCKHCEVELTQDNWRYMGRKRPTYTCRVCDRAIAKERAQAKRKYVADYKMSKGCGSCGYNKKHYVLELCHIDSKDKTNRYGSNMSAYNQSWSIPRIDKELARCRVLCANCHREETAVELGWKEYGD